MKTKIKMSSQSIFKYNPSFKKVGLEKVKLKTITAKAEELCAQFDIGGIKTSLYVFEDFEIAHEASSQDQYRQL